MLAHLKDNPDTAARVTQAVKLKLAELGARMPGSAAEEEEEDSVEQELTDEALVAELAD